MGWDRNDSSMFTQRLERASRKDEGVGTKTFIGNKRRDAL